MADRDGPAGWLADWVRDTPPITRAYAAAVLAASLAEHLQLVAAWDLAMLWPQVLQSHEARGRLGRRGPGALVAVRRAPGFGGRSRPARAMHLLVLGSVPRASAGASAAAAARRRAPPPQPARPARAPTRTPPSPPQWWRPLTAALYLPLGLGLVFQLAMLVQYGGMLEGEVFRRSPAGAPRGPRGRARPVAR
jgi:hypothetical protein